MVSWGDGIQVTVDVRQVVVQLLLRLQELRSSVVGNRYKPTMEKSYGKDMGKVSILLSCGLEGFEGLGWIGYFMNVLELIKMGFQHIIM